MSGESRKRTGRGRKRIADESGISTGGSSGVAPGASSGGPSGVAPGASSGGPSGVAPRASSGGPSGVAPGAHLTPRAWAALGLLFLVAAALRLWTASAFSQEIRIHEPVMDGRYYLDMAARLAGGDGWPERPLFMTPLYPAILSLFFRVAPVSVTVVQVFQGILGLATLGILFHVVRRDLGAAAAWGAAVLFVLYGPVLGNESQVLTESLLLFLGTAAVWLWPWPGRSPWKLFLFGMVCGLLILGRGVFIFLPAGAALLWILRGWGESGIASGGKARSRVGAGVGVRSWALPLFWIGLGMALALLPVTIHQTRKAGRLTVLTLNGGLNLYIGNNPHARGVYSQPPEIDLENDLTAARSASILAGETLDLPQANRFWMRRTLQFVQDDPGHQVWLLWRKAMLYLSPREIPQIEAFELLREDHAPLRAAFLDFAWIFPLAVLGAVGWFLRRGKGRAGLGRTKATAHSDHRFRGLDPYLVLMAVGWAATILFFATGRYRIPYLTGFLAAAGLGLAFLWQAVRTRRLSWILILVPAAAGLQFALPGYSLDSVRSHDAYQTGIRLARVDRPAEAVKAYQEAIRWQPSRGESWHGLGAALVDMGRLPEAAEAYERASGLLPRTALTRYNLGIVYGRMGRDDRALEQFRQAVELDPYDSRMRSDLGVALARLGRMAEAESSFREALRLDPGYEPARRHLLQMSRETGGGPE